MLTETLFYIAGGLLRLALFRPCLAHLPPAQRRVRAVLKPEEQEVHAGAVTPDTSKHKLVEFASVPAVVALRACCCRRRCRTKSETCRMEAALVVDFRSNLQQSPGWTRRNMLLWWRGNQSQAPLPGGQLQSTPWLRAEELRSTTDQAAT